MDTKKQTWVLYNIGALRFWVAEYLRIVDFMIHGMSLH